MAVVVTCTQTSRKQEFKRLDSLHVTSNSLHNFEEKTEDAGNELVGLI